MLLYFIRHGDPDYSTDSLTPLGRRQAEAVAHRLAVCGVDKIYASPLGRAQQTAEPTAEMLRLPVNTEDWTSESTAWKEFTTVFPDGKRRWIFALPVTDILTDETVNLTWDNWLDAPFLRDCAAPKEGFERIKEASDEFFARHGYEREGRFYRVTKSSDERIAIFAHGGFGTVWLSILLGIPPHFVFPTFSIPHCGMSIFEFGGRDGDLIHPNCLALNDTGAVYADRLPLRYNNSIKY